MKKKTIHQIKASLIASFLETHGYTCVVVSMRDVEGIGAAAFARLSVVDGTPTYKFFSHHDGSLTSFSAFILGGAGYVFRDISSHILMESQFYLVEGGKVVVMHGELPSPCAMYEMFLEIVKLNAL